METSGDEATAGMNTGRFLTKAATQRPAADAIRYLDRTISYADFSERSRRLGGAFLDLGLRHGDRVAIVQHNCPEYLETLYGGSRYVQNGIATPLLAFYCGAPAIEERREAIEEALVWFARRRSQDEPSRDAASTKMCP